MKICHCVKLTDEEVKAFDTVRAVLNEMNEDDMLTNKFDTYDVNFGDISYWLGDVMDFIRQFNG